MSIRRERSAAYLLAAIDLLDSCVYLLERADECRARAHAIDVKAYDDARTAVGLEMIERRRELAIELGIREKLDERDRVASGVTDDISGLRF